MKIIRSYILFFALLFVNSFSAFSMEEEEETPLSQPRTIVIDLRVNRENSVVAPDGWESAEKSQLTVVGGLKKAILKQD